METMLYASAQRQIQVNAIEHIGVKPAELQLGRGDCG